MTRRSFRGFTLIELLAVIAIIGILATLSAIGLSTARKRARDAQRERDLSVLKQAVELYFQDHDSYPPNEDAVFKTAAGSLVEGKYMARPLTGVNGKLYKYFVDTSATTGPGFLIYSDLEYAKGTPTLTGKTCSQITSATAIKGSGMISNGTAACFVVTND